MKEIVCEVFLYHISLIAAADNELIDPIVRIDFHDMPQDGLPADLDHGLGLDFSFFGQACTESSSQYYGFHSKMHL